MFNLIETIKPFNKNENFNEFIGDSIDISEEIAKRFEKYEVVIMNEFCAEDFIHIDKCPWCGKENSKIMYNNTYETSVMLCLDCGLVYADKILNSTGLNKYWSNYLSLVQNDNDELVDKREIMYKLEFEYINDIIDCKNKNVLDIGCGSGRFLDFFSENGAQCFGVEYGREAAEVSGKRYKVWLGEFPKIDIDTKFDLIIFRGTLQYCINPKEYLNKAMKLLNSGGYIYITSTPNSDSLCFNLFEDKFTLPVSVTDYYAFKESLLTKYINEVGGKLFCKYSFYKETPYANVEEDIEKVNKALSYKKSNKKIDFKSPPFFDNMLTLVYRKI